MGAVAVLRTVHVLKGGRLGDIVDAVLKVLVLTADLAGMRLRLGGIRAAFGSGFPVLVCWWPLLQDYSRSHQRQSS